MVHATTLPPPVPPSFGQTTIDGAHRGKKPSTWPSEKGTGERRPLTGPLSLTISCGYVAIRAGAGSLSSRTWEGLQLVPSAPGASSRQRPEAALSSAPPRLVRAEGPFIVNGLQRFSVASSHTANGTNETMYVTGWNRVSSPSGSDTSSPMASPEANDVVADSMRRDRPDETAPAEKSEGRALLAHIFTLRATSVTDVARDRCLSSLPPTPHGRGASLPRPQRA